MFTRLLGPLKSFLGELLISNNKELAPIELLDQAETTNYTEEFINFRCGDVRICGTLTRPNTNKKCPAVVLIHGSGPHTRDEIIGPHQPFRLLADYLSRRGIAVLRYDKRGVAYSSGNYETATSLDFANDAEAAFNFLRSHPNIDAHRIGLLGHSEGGMIAPIVAFRIPPVAFIVLMAAPAIPAVDMLVSQVVAFTALQGLNGQHTRHEVRLAKKTYAIVRNEPDNAIAAEKIRMLRKGHPQSEIQRAAMDSSIAALTSPWFRYFLKHDPRLYLRALTCPVLALNGDKDMQVFADPNLTSFNNCLARNPNALAVKLSGLNHIFQTCNTGMPDEYESLPETLAPTVLQLISSWICKTTSH